MTVKSSMTATSTSLRVADGLGSLLITLTWQSKITSLQSITFSCLQLWKLKSTINPSWTTSWVEDSLLKSNLLFDSWPQILVIIQNTTRMCWYWHIMTSSLIASQRAHICILLCSVLASQRVVFHCQTPTICVQDQKRLEVRTEDKPISCFLS